ncbi:serine acetyltransferase [Nissabacter sp. SGAir0207]|nr:serine acetyltransferase [Nissabacter sp. SGAir0207]
MKSDKEFSWLKTIHKVLKCPDRRFYFWWRIANYFYLNNKYKKHAVNFNRKLRNRYGLHIKLGAQIGEGLRIAHYVGIVIAECSVIGKNFYIKQNVTIGIRHLDQAGKIYIGDNVEVGANSCIIGDNLRIGDNVVIGAMTFVNKDVPAGSVVYNRKELHYL